jgi:hypothetical protein
VNDLDSHLDTAAADLWAALGDIELALPDPGSRRRGVAAIGAAVILAFSVVGAGWLASRRTGDDTASTSAASVSPQAVPAQDQLAAEVVSAANELGWSLSLPDDLISSAPGPVPTIPTSPRAAYAEVHFKTGDGQLLVSLCVCDDAAVAAGTTGRTGLLRTDGTASVYLGTDGDHARAVELYDRSRILYVRSESPTAASSLDVLASLAVAIDSRTSFASSFADNGSTATTGPALSNAAVTPTTVEAPSRSTVLTSDDPETVTGDKIGDPVDASGSPPGLAADGSFDLTKIPAWISVSKDGVVVGYAKKTDLYSAPDIDQRGPSEPTPVYDNHGIQIGVLGPDGYVPNGR